MTAREDLRFNTSLPARLNEFAILINARFWGSRYEWSAHKPHEELSYDFCDLVGVNGYYTLVSMVLKVAGILRPPGEKSPW